MFLSWVVEEVVEMQCKNITDINHDFRVFTMPLFLFVETRIECKITHHLLSISFTVAGARTIRRLFTHVLFVQNLFM